jgi:GNAT superfamily N-acetyltransferase
VLPVGLDALREEARTEGYRMLDRLAEDWRSGAVRFDRPGEMLLAASVDRIIAAIGGLTLDPAVPGALRMRRFYVSRKFRRSGVGRQLAVTLLQSPIRDGRVVMVNAAAGSAPFWEALGFLPDARDGHTHALLPS